MSKTGLGRGLSALLGGAGATPGAASGFGGRSALPAVGDPLPSAQAEGAASNPGQVRRVSIRSIHPCSFQPRKDFSEESLVELADSIRQKGVIQPLLVRGRGEGFELIAGERRWRAAQKAGMNEVPVIVIEADDRAVLELALIENLQRENLNPIEEAHGYSQLAGQFELTQEEIATRVGKSRAAVANAMRLLNLAPEIQTHVRQGRLSAGHAKVLLGLGNRDAQLRAVGKVLEGELTVRQTEELVARMSALKGAMSNPVAAGAKSAAEVHAKELENRLQQRLGSKVNLRYKKGKGLIEIRFFSDDDLSRILEMLGVTLD